MTARGMKPQTVADIVAIMKLQYHFARTGQGWEEYAAARQKLTAAGLVVQVTDSSTTDPSEDGIVLEQRPGPSTSVEEGETVTIVVGRLSS